MYCTSVTWGSVTPIPIGDDILAVVFGHIAQAGMTPAIERHMSAVQQGDSVAQLAAWNALNDRERAIVKQAYILGTRRDNTA